MDAWTAGPSTHDTRCDRLSVVIDADFDHFEPADDHFVLRAVLRTFDGYDDVVDSVAAHGQLTQRLLADAS
jgi:hypothetical protein